MIVYILNIIICCYFLHFYNAEKKESYLIASIPVIIIFVIIVGGQYRVGADYDAYLYSFENINHCFREPLFNLVKTIFSSIGVTGQGLFFCFALIDAIILFIAIYKFRITNLSILYYLIIVVSTYFNNSMNMLRQVVADVIVFWAFIEFYRNKTKGIILVAIATGFHYSAMLMIIFVFIKPIVVYTTKLPYFLLVLTTVLGTTNLLSADIVNNYIFMWMPDVGELDYYRSAYAGSDLYYNNTSTIYRVSKIFYVPLYFLSIKSLDNYLLNSYNKFIFRFGLLSFCLRIILLQNNLVGRFSGYFWLPSVFPIYYLLKYYWDNKRINQFVLCSFYSIIPYLIKIINGEYEYKYHFFLFQ